MQSEFTFPSLKIYIYAKQLSPGEDMHSTFTSAPFLKFCHLLLPKLELPPVPNAAAEVIHPNHAHSVSHTERIFLL